MTTGAEEVTTVDKLQLHFAGGGRGEEEEGEEEEEEGEEEEEEEEEYGARHMYQNSSEKKLGTIFGLLYKVDPYFIK